MKRDQIISTILAVRPETVVVLGPMGWGKSSLLRDIAEQMSLEDRQFLMNCSRLQEGDLAIPKFEGNPPVVRDIPHERTGLQYKEPIVVCLDEMFKADRRIQVQMGEFLLSRSIGSYRLHEDSVLFGTSNLEEEGFEDESLGFIYDRCIILRMNKPSAKEWVEGYALKKGIHSTIVDACLMTPQFFEEYDGESSNDNPFIFRPGVVKCVTGRSLERASDVLYKVGHLDDEYLVELLSGIVGEPAAARILVSVKVWKKLPLLADVMKGKTVKVKPVHEIICVTEWFNQLRTQEYDDEETKTKDFNKLSKFIFDSFSPEARAIYLMAIIRDKDYSHRTTDPMYTDQLGDVGILL